MAQPDRKSEYKNDGDCENAPQTSTGELADKGWFRIVLPVAVVAACAELGIAILNNSTLPIYFTKGLGLDPFVSGLLMIPFFISEALFKLPLGVLADRFGRKPLMTGGALVTVFTPLILMMLHYHRSAPGSVWILLGFGLLRLLDGLGGAALWPALFAYIGDRVAECKRGAAMGLLNVVYMIGLALGFYIGGQADDIFGPVFTGDASMRNQVGELGRRISNGLHRHHHAIPPAQFSLYHPGHYYPSFYLSSALFVLATFVCIVGLQGRAARAAGSPHEEHEQITWQRFTETARTVPQYIVLAFVTFLGIGNIAPIVKLFALDEFHMTEQQVGLLTLCTALIVATVAYPLGHLADRWGKVKSVRLGFSLCALGLWGIPTLLHLHSVREVGFVISAAVIGMGFVIAFPAWNALLTTLSDEKRRGAVIGTVSAGQGVGMLLGYISGGAVYRPRHFMAFGHMMHIGGHSAPFFLAALLVSIGAIGSILTIHESRAQSD